MLSVQICVHPWPKKLPVDSHAKNRVRQGLGSFIAGRITTNELQIRGHRDHRDVEDKKWIRVLRLPWFNLPQIEHGIRKLAAHHQKKPREIDHGASLLLHQSQSLERRDIDD